MVRRLILGVLLASPLLAQQSNGKNYTVPTYTAGNPDQDSNDSGVNANILTVPFVLPAGSYSSFGTFFMVDTTADSAGTNSHGMALYNSSKSRLCFVYGARTTVVGINSFSPTGCGTPTAGTYYLAYLTSFSSDTPGDNNGSHVSSQACPTSSGAFSGFVGGSSFTTTLGTTSAQGFCYSFWLTVNLAGGGNGRYYGGNAGFANQVGGIPTGPWGTNGLWYGGQNLAATFVQFGDGLSSATSATTTTLGTATHGGPCTWSLSNGSTNLTGNASGTKALLTPVAISSANYSAAGSLSMQYATNTTANYAICALGSTYASMSLGFHITTDIPSNDTAADWYDSGKAVSSDNTDAAGIFIYAGGAVINIFGECEVSSSTTYGSQGYIISPNTNYWIWIQKNTGGANNVIDIFNQDAGGALVGQITCASTSGTHDASSFATVVHGSETQSSGHHIWVNQFEVSTTGAALVP